MTIREFCQKEIRAAWSTHAVLTATAAIMLAAFCAAMVGIFADPRLITGAPAWLKPAKFGISSAVYAATLVWLLRYLTVSPRLARALGTVIATVLLVEVGIIDVQAARGTTSHFNAATPLDFALWMIMGVAILILLLASIGIVVLLFRQPFQRRAWGRVLRAGMLITIL